MEIFIVISLSVLLIIEACLVAKLYRSLNEEFNELESRLDDECQEIYERLDSLKSHYSGIESLCDKLTADFTQVDANMVNKRINRTISRIKNLEYRVEGLESLTRRHEQKLSCSIVEDTAQYISQKKPNELTENEY